MNKLWSRPKQRSFRRTLKRHPWIAVACVALGTVAMVLLIGYFTFIFPAEEAAAKMQSDLAAALPNAEFVAGVASESKTLRPYIFVEVSFVGDERKQLEMREWLSTWKVDHELRIPVALRFHDPEYPKRWLNQLVL